MAVVVLASGRIGGKGIRVRRTEYRTRTNQLKSLKGNIRKAISNPKGYRRQLNSAIKKHAIASRKAVKATTKSFVVATFFSTAMGRIKNLFRR